MMKIVERLVAIAASVLLFALMMLMVFDVVGRNILHHPVQGATELTEIGLVTVTFLLFPTLAVRNGHIVADVADALHSRVLDVLKLVLTALLGVGVFGLMAWRMWLLGLSSSSYGEASPTLQVPLAPFLFAASILAGVCALCFLVSLRDLPRTLRRPSTEADPSKTVL